MAAHWNIEVLSIAGTRLELSIHQIHPDAGAFLNSAASLIRVLHEPAWKFNLQFEYEATGPLGTAISRSQQQDDTWLQENAAAYIREFQLQIRRPPIDEAKALEKVMLGLGIGAGYDQLTSAQKEAVNQAYQEFWRLPEHLPLAIYQLEVSDPKWIAHLQVGLVWNSAAY